MLSWASSRLERLAQTVAPPPTDPVTKFIYCCQRDDEEGALAVLQQSMPDPVYTIVQTTKGQAPIHLACLYSMPKLIQHILQHVPEPTALMQIVDAEGNNAVHCACMSNKPNALDIVKMLLQTQPNTSSVCTKNRMGQTPYDVAGLNMVRQYLLPIQLQAETQAALDNGGRGLPPGIDLGGLKITNSHLPPPPMGMNMPMNGGAAPQKYVAQQFPGQQMPGQQQQFQQQPPAVQNATPPQQLAPPAGAASMFATPSPQSHPQPSPAPTVNTSTEATPPPPASAEGMTTPTNSRPPPAPASTGSQSGYALRGQSSAAIYKGRSGIQPDGFHSSSSDKSLQEKYGHSQTDYSHIPPPPTSGNSAGINSGNFSGGGGPFPHSAPSSGGANPFAGGLSALNNRTAAGSSRYVAYDPVRGARPQAFPAPPGSGGAPANNFNTFAPSQQQPAANSFQQPAGSNFQQPPGTNFQQQQQQQQPGGAMVHSAPSSTFMPAPPGQQQSFTSPAANTGKTPANTPLTPLAGAGFTPPPYHMTRQNSSGGAATSPAATFSSPSKASAAGTFASPGTGAPSPSAAGTFSAPPNMPGSGGGLTTQRSLTSENTGSNTSASALFASASPTKASSSSSSTTAAAVTTLAEQSSSPPAAPVATPPAVDAAQLFGGTANKVPDSAAAANSLPAPGDGGGDEDDMQEVPLTPGDMSRKPAAAAPTASATSSLTASIGLPPPPFPRK